MHEQGVLMEPNCPATLTFSAAQQLAEAGDSSCWFADAGHRSCLQREWERKKGVSAGAQRTLDSGVGDL